MYIATAGGKAVRRTNRKAGGKENMYYSEISGVKVSALGMGNMRLPKIENQGEKIDLEKAQEITITR